MVNVIASKGNVWGFGFPALYSQRTMVVAIGIGLQLSLVITL